jgi:hypothetical protein
MTEADQNPGTILEDVSGFSGRYWHALEDGRIQCDLCPRLCKLNDGQPGLWFVRARADEQVVLITYDRSSGPWRLSVRKNANIFSFTTISISLPL